MRGVGGEFELSAAGELDRRRHAPTNRHRAEEHGQEEHGRDEELGAHDRGACLGHRIHRLADDDVVLTLGPPSDSEIHPVQRDGLGADGALQLGRQYGILGLREHGPVGRDGPGEERRAEGAAFRSGLPRNPVVGRPDRKVAERRIQSTVDLHREVVGRDRHHCGRHHEIGKTHQQGRGERHPDGPSPDVMRLRGGHASSRR